MSQDHNINSITAVPGMLDEGDSVQAASNRPASTMSVKKRGVASARAKSALGSQSAVSGNASATELANNNKASKRPKNTALKQQRLPAWQPVLTAKTVLPLFFAVGVIFCTLGGVLLHYSNLVNEKVVDYTNCYNVLPTGGGMCKDIAKFNVSCACELTVQLDTEFKGPVFIYYGLKNFYQNHRRYVKSRDDSQLLGKSVTTLNTECEPYDKINGSQIAPCGAIANSLFNDTFTVAYTGPSNTNGPTGVNLLRTGIAWTTDKNTKFNNPDSWANTVKPKNWQKAVFDLDPTDPSNTGYKNEDLIVWMRTAALPSFRKLYRRVDHAQANFTSGLPAGYYKITVAYNYPVAVFNGEKSFIISTTTWIGGKNPFLGIAYLVVGSLCILLGICFLIIHFKFSRNVKTPEDFDGHKKQSVATITPEGHF